MGDQSKFLDEIRVIAFSYDINDMVNDIKRKIGRHRGKVTLERLMEKTTW